MKKNTLYQNAITLSYLHRYALGAESTKPKVKLKSLGDSNFGVGAVLHSGIFFGWTQFVQSLCDELTF